MLESFKNYANTNHLFEQSDKVLLAVSGGIDSMVMVDLFYQSGFSFAIAHCNYQLRGEESDGDEAFVKAKAAEYKVSCYVERFDTLHYASANKLSIQMAARDLRYKWFKELINEEGYAYYATAHHHDDELETFFINLTRGSGIAGLHGILPRQNRLIHPMLFAWREEIEAYAYGHKIAYRVDSSNLTTKYIRNQIRHRLMPLLKEINPHYREILASNIERIRQAEHLYRKEIRRKHHEWVQPASDGFKIAIAPLQKESGGKTYLYEFLAPCGFTWNMTDEIMQTLDATPGKQFYSSSHRVLKDRDYLIISSIDESEAGEYLLYENDTEMTEPFRLTKTVKDYNSNEDIPKNRYIACLDHDKLQFPLKIRKWQDGDRFKPLGMQTYKKISDFFIDEKFSLAEKEKAWLLLSGDDIAWVIGYRIDDRFKLTPETRKICQLELLKQHD
ncbi:MAG: tRNA lysidine(34) synthetase TilS [Bacteroidales bacterium]|nr:tRNA lysidine(34) synthetase TilS [Bacteroidales bacterium]